VFLLQEALHVLILCERQPENRPNLSFSGFAERTPQSLTDLGQSSPLRIGNIPTSDDGLLQRSPLRCVSVSAPNFRPTFDQWMSKPILTNFTHPFDKP
jgi:hypothetical protein